MANITSTASSQRESVGIVMAKCKPLIDNLSKKMDALFDATGMEFSKSISETMAEPGSCEIQEIRENLGEVLQKEVEASQTAVNDVLEQFDAFIHEVYQTCSQPNLEYVTYKTINDGEGEIALYLGSSKLEYPDGKQPAFQLAAVAWRNAKKLISKSAGHEAIQALMKLQTVHLLGVPKRIENGSLALAYKLLDEKDVAQRVHTILLQALCAMILSEFQACLLEIGMRPRLIQEFETWVSSSAELEFDRSALITHFRNATN